MNVNRVLAAMASMLAVACASMEPAGIPVSGPVSGPEGAIAGYQHGLDRSRFAVGENVRVVRERGYWKHVGSTGTFAISERNGSVLALTNAAVSTGSEPVRISAEEHERVVRAYFVKAGIPAAQIAGIRTSTLLVGGGPSGSPPRQPRVSAYYAVLERSIEGVAVPDSMAWARVDSNGVVLEEGVYWPAIPRPVAEEAVRLARRISDGRDNEQLLARSPPGASSTRPTIRHTAASSNADFEAFAGIDALYKATSGTGDSSATAREYSLLQHGFMVERHFDANGAQFKLPQERNSHMEDIPTPKRSESAPRPQ